MSLFFFVKKEQITSKLVVALIAVTVVSGMTASAYAAAQANTFVEKISVDITDFVPCAAGGAGEYVHLTGKLNQVFHSTVDSAGGAHVKVHINDQGISGTGLTTGDKYQGTGATNSEFNVKVGVEHTTVETLNLIGQGNGNNLLMRLMEHITINANGIVTAEMENVSVECK